MNNCFITKICNEKEKKNAIIENKLPGDRKIEKAHHHFSNKMFIGHIRPQKTFKYLHINIKKKLIRP